MTFVADPTSVLPFTNITVTAIKGGGTSKYRGTPAGSDPVTRFSGSLDAWLGAEVLTDFRGEDRTEIERAYIGIPRSANTGIQRGDTVLYTEDSQPKEREVKDIKNFDVVGITRLYLIDE